MPLAPGTRLGPYEIVAPLGAGGMGEVFRATDTRLGRDVAVKVLPQHLSASPEARARFEREAKMVSSLNHPHICALFDVGREGDTDYLVMELVEGETLAQRLGKGALPAADVLHLGGQIADALDRAHRAGVIHRDLKPGNVMLTKSGAKLMDFGLARETGMAGPASGSGVTVAALTQSPTVAAPLTAEGTIVGTFQYMAPEQLEGDEADARSDLWALGCVLYEMATGRRAFEGKSQASLITSIMGSEPPPISQLAPLAPPGLERLVRACLAKDPADRLQNAHDIRMQLAWLAEGVSQASVAAPVAAARGRSRAWLWSGAIVVAAALGWLGASRLTPREALPRFQKLTFQRGTIFSARLGPDGQTVVYGADWGGKGLQLYTTRLDATESRPTGEAADILAISQSGEMALSLNRRTVSSLMSVGTLARAPLGAGAPRELLDGVIDADWSPDGTQLAVTREVDGEARLEYPVGKVLQRSGGYLSTPRVSPDGKSVAFIQHQVKGDDRGVVALVGPDGRARIISPDLPSITGLAWSPKGDEVWYSAWIVGTGYAIEAVKPGGHTRIVYRSGVRTRLFDVRGERALIGHESALSGASGLMAGETHETDLSFLDGTCATDLSADGSELLFTEAWIGGGPGYSVFLRESSTRYPVRLGDGWGSDLSADGKWVLSYPVDPPMRLVLTPTGTGETRKIELPGFEAIGLARWFPDEKRILVWASEPGGAFRGYVVDVAGGTPRLVTPPGVSAPLFSNASYCLSPDGKLLAATGGERGLALYPVDGGDPRSVPGVRSGDVPVAWTDAGRGLLVRQQGEIPSRVYVLDLETGRRTLWKELIPADASGVLEILGVVTTPDRRYYTYTYLRALTELYVVEGLK